MMPLFASPAHRRISPSTEGSAEWGRLRRMALRVAKPIVRDPFIAEDIAQEASLRLMVRAQTVHIDDKSGFVSTVARHLAIDHLRTGSCRFETLSTDGRLDDISSDARFGDPAESLDQRLTLELALSRLVARLRPPERVILVLHDVFDYTFPEVAEFTGRNEATCRQVAGRARRRLAATDQHPDQSAHAGTTTRHIAPLFQAGDVEELLAVLARTVVDSRR
jgi:RNA polymerase sigma-70 factor, ECF subfamily